MTFPLVTGDYYSYINQIYNNDFSWLMQSDAMPTSGDSVTIHKYHVKWHNYIITKWWIKTLLTDENIVGNIERIPDLLRTINTGNILWYAFFW